MYFEFLARLSFLLHHNEHRIRNNGFMRIRVEIPIHEAIVFNFGTANADTFLKQHPPRVLLVGQQLVEGLPVPFGFACGGGNALLLQHSVNLVQTVAAEVALKNPTDNGGFIWANDQLTVRTSIISVASALGHLGSSIPKTFLKPNPDGLAFLISFIDILFQKQKLQ